MATVRDATPDDAYAIARIHVASWQATYVGIFPDAFLAEMEVGPRAERWAEGIAAGGSPVVVAENDDGVVVGFSAAYPDPDEPGTMSVRTLYLDPEAKGAGFGRALLEAVCERIAALGYATTYLEVDVKNGHAIGFYEHMGWVTDGVARPFTMGELSSTVYRYTRPLAPETR